LIEQSHFGKEQQPVVTDWDALSGSDWKGLLGQEFKKPYWSQLQKFLGNQRSRFEVYPPPKQVFNALQLTNCAKTKVVIVGQDPYPSAGQAHGLAFSVRGKVVPASLANIFRGLHADVSVCSIPDHGNLERWAQQGVLLLNTTLTVRAGEPRSHKGKGWETFTDAVISVVDAETAPVFILWGKDAQRKEALINKSSRKVIKSPHPSSKSAYKGFFGSKPFSRANEILAAEGREGIDWRLPK
jgi:uracil-DNA glycosylase